VDLILNGEYKGNFDLCDKIDEKRVDLGELEEGVEEEPVDGGFLFEATQYAYREGFYINTTRGIILGLRYPDEDEVTVEQLEYITNKLNKVEQDGYNGIVDDIDFESFSKYLLVQELCGQSETFWSTYMTKKRNDDKIYFGPVWDFDLAFDNDRRVYSTLNKTNFLFKYDSSAGTMREFGVKLLNNEELLQRLLDGLNRTPSSPENAKVLVTILGIVFSMLAIFELINALLSIKGVKSNRSGLMVLNIIFGVIAGIYINSLGGIFGLVDSKKN
jgi:hypothetical protein